MWMLLTGSIVFMWSYGSTNWTELTLGLCLINVALRDSDLEVSVFLLNYLGVSCYEVADILMAFP